MNHPTQAITRLISGDLSGPDATALHAHLRQCPTCRAHYDRIEALEVRLRAVPRLPTPPDLVVQVQARIAQTPARSARQPWLVPVLVLLAGMLVTAASFDSLLLVSESTAQLPGWSDINGWLVWFNLFSVQLEASLVVGTCLLAAGSVLVVLRLLAHDWVPASNGIRRRVA